MERIFKHKNGNSEVITRDGGNNTLIGREAHTLYYEIAKRAREQGISCIQNSKTMVDELLAHKDWREELTNVYRS